MRATRIVSSFASWRWMPFCALAGGSLLFVGLAVLIVPKSLGKLPHTQLALPGGDSDTLTSSSFGNGASLTAHGDDELGSRPKRRLAGQVPERTVPLVRQHQIVEPRAAALGAPPMAPPPEPTPPPRPPEPQTLAEREAAKPIPDPPMHPHETPKIIGQRAFGGRLRMVAPRLAAQPDETKPADEGSGTQPPADE